MHVAAKNLEVVEVSLTHRDRSSSVKDETSRCQGRDAIALVELPVYRSCSVMCMKAVGVAPNYRRSKEGMDGRRFWITSPKAVGSSRGGGSSPLCRYPCCAQRLCPCQSVDEPVVGERVLPAAAEPPTEDGGTRPRHLQHNSILELQEVGQVSVTVRCSFPLAEQLLVSWCSSAAATSSCRQ